MKRGRVRVRLIKLLCEVFMSSILDGVLRMPPDCWTDEAIDVHQLRSRYVQAADRIKELEKILRVILDAHNIGCVDWPAMRRAKELLDT
jgi:hypothetical protein